MREELSAVDGLRLTAQTALLTHVTPPLRSVSVDLDAEARVVFVRFIFDRAPSPSQRDAASTAATEIGAAYPAPWMLDEEYVICPAPEPMRHLTWVVYHRCEDDWVSPTT
jgi:hypothetical protein